MKTNSNPDMTKEISCRITRTLIMYVRENNGGRLGPLLDDLPVDEVFLSDTNNWISHALLQTLYQRMIVLLGDENAVYHMTLAAERYGSMGILDRIVRLMGSPRLIYSQAPKYNTFLKLNGSVIIHDIGRSWIVLEDRYHDGTQKTRFDCDYTRGVLAGIPTLFGLPLAEVEEIKCQVAAERYGTRRWLDNPPQGAAGCFYRVRWVQPRQSVFKRFFSWRSYEHAIDELVEANRLIQSKYDQVKVLMRDLERTNRDLVASKQALEAQRSALIASERKYRNLFENGSDLVCIHDLEGNLLETNVPHKKIYGWRWADLEGRNIRNLIPERYRSQFDDYLARILRTGSDEGYLKVMDRSGNPVVLEYRNRLIRSSSGEPEAVHGAARDVTQRIQNEKALKESQEKYKNIVQYAPAGIYELDLKTMAFISVNDVLCEYTGHGEAELLALDPLSLVAGEHRPTVATMFREVAARRPRELAFEYELAGKGGIRRWVLSNARFFYAGETPRLAMVVVHDVTAIKRAEAEKKALEIKLQNARKLESLGTLAGGVAHDLNNILSGIVSYPDLLLYDMDADHPLRGPLLSIRKSGQKAADIVQDLLTLARRNVSMKTALDFNRIIRDFIDSPECRKIIADARSIQVETRLSDAMLNLSGSEMHLSKTIMNLVKNAADAMPAGGTVTIATRDAYLDQPHDGFETIPRGEYVILEIRDTGIGMPATDLERIFEPFFTKKVMGRSGTGLGMSVVWGTVKDHDGYFDILTEEGTGTTFVLYFPVCRNTIEMETPVVRIDDYLGQGERILIVDDAAEQRDLMHRMMQRLGYDSTTADSGEAALDALARQPFDLVILDMIMPPGMDGLDTYRRVLEIRPGQKAIVASGYAQTQRVQEARRLGAGSYIRKPFTLEKIGLAVRKELDGDGSM